MKNTLIAAFLALAVGACAKPYDSPVIDAGGNASTPLAFDGIRQSVLSGDTRILWIHGMCGHDKRWAIERQRIVTSALGVDGGVEQPNNGSRPGYKVRYYTAVGDNSLTTDYLIWSDFTNPAKQQLDFDNPLSGEFPYERASLNNDLKVGLINDCFSDAVIYSGRAGDPIRQWVKREVCEGLGGRLEGRICNLPNDRVIQNTILVAESLGSKLMIDAVREIWDAPLTADQRSNLARQLSSVQQVFLLANQVPLLDVANPISTSATRKATNGISGLANILSSARARSAQTRSLARVESVQIIAFTDPNDLLSYRLLQAKSGIEHAKILNLIVSNDYTYFGLLERPDYAHCGYKWNGQVLGAIVNGWPNAGPLSLPVDKKSCV